MTQKCQNLVSYYQCMKRTHKIKFVRKVARRCDLSSGAVMKWVFGDGKPSKPEYIDVLVEETGILAKNLFNRDLDERC